MTVITLIIFCLTSSVAIIQNHPNPSSSFKFDDDDDTLADMIETLKKAEAENKEMNEKRVASFDKGVQQASESSNGTFSFPANCTPTSRNESYPFCFHGSLREQNKSTDDTTKTTKVHAAVDFFDIFNPNESTAIGLKALYEDEEVEKLDAEAGGHAELLSYGNKSSAAISIYLDTHVEELHHPGQLGIMRSSFVSKVHFKFYEYGYLVMDMESIPVQSSDVFAGKSFNLGFNMSAFYEESVPGVPFTASAGASVELSLRTGKNDLEGHSYEVHKWTLLGKAEMFIKTPITIVHFPYTYISQVISV
ncbi:hypothetical protein FOL47_010660 [Perkinsus chesapeaki]|uniref:Mitochondrial import receptor subunit TOM40B n=1 Tax=Perkinsus chesapeaki TaxID=330153 RepID=A0A7J6L341_PERCH|nr:hypothetical protein FOL47_010660 [Perkinsus chesapeaki]